MTLTDTATGRPDDDIAHDDIEHDEADVRTGGDEVAPRAGDPRRWWGVLLVGGVLGIVTTVTQTVERIEFLKNPDAASVCDINAKLSCTSVFSMWQSSALGIPNSLIGLTVFAFLASAGLAGVLGTRPARAYTAVVMGLTVFMAGFITWYMVQSAFVMKTLCLFCVACAVNVVIAGIGITRAADADAALGTGRAGRTLRVAVDSSADLALWLGLGVLIALMLLWGLVLL